MGILEMKTLMIIVAAVLLIVGLVMRYGKNKSRKKKAIVPMILSVLVVVATLGYGEYFGNTDVEADSEDVYAEQVNIEDLEGLKVHFIDVGQADAALLEYQDDGKEYHILIDSGDWKDNRTVDYLNKEGITDLDLLVGTHPHSDHIGKMDEIIEDFNVEEVWMSGDDATSQVFERVVDAIESNDVDYNEPKAGETYDIGSLHIEVISPASLTGDLNNGSIVLKLTYGGVDFLFTGDIETAAEEGILERGEDIKADILKVGHHGSETSSTQAFVDKVEHEVAIISVGENNKYGHPHESVLNRLVANGEELYSTKDNGTVIVETDGNNYTVTTENEQQVTSESEGNVEKSVENKNEDVKEEPVELGECVDINTASAEELQEIVQIGPARAADVIDERPYDEVDNLDKVSGIGQAIVDDVKEQGLACVN